MFSLLLYVVVNGHVPGYRRSSRRCRVAKVVVRTLYYLDLGTWHQGHRRMSCVDPYSWAR